MNNQQGQQPQWPPSQPSYGQPNQQLPQYQSQWQQPPSQPLPPQQQWQQPMPPQQEWQQQPYYPPQYQPSEKPRSSFKLGLGIGCGIMAAFAIGVVVLAILVSAGRQSSTTQQQFGTHSANQPTTTPQATTFKIGETASNTLWSVTVNSVKEVTSGTFSQPGTGMIFLVVDVATENLSSSPQLVSSVASFTLKDATGQAYTEVFTGIGKPPDDTALQPNDKLRGQISYEVPKSMHNFTFQFQGNMLDASAATWVFTI